MPLWIELGRGRTPVPEMNFEEARELATILLAEKLAHRTEGGYGGQHIAYQKLPHYLRGSDRSERMYSAVKLLMRAGRTEAQACRVVAEILGPNLGKSKRGRPVENPTRSRRSAAETVRSLLHSYEKRNPFPPPEESADYIDSRVEYWYSYAYMIRSWKKDDPRPLPPGWKSSPMPDGSMSNEPKFPASSESKRRSSK